MLSEAPLEVSDEQALPVLLEVRCCMPAGYLHVGYDSLSKGVMP